MFENYKSGQRLTSFIGLTSSLSLINGKGVVPATDHFSQHLRLIICHPRSHLVKHNHTLILWKRSAFLGSPKTLTIEFPSYEVRSSELGI